MKSRDALKVASFKVDLPEIDLFELRRLW
jgi:hypothetical protein